MEKRIFVSAIIKAEFFYFGEYKQMEIPINKIIKLENENLLDDLDNVLIQLFGEITYRGEKYTDDKIAYNVKYNTINSL